MEKSRTVKGEFVEELKNLCRAYLVHKKDYSSISFVFYTLLSCSDCSDNFIITVFLKEIGDYEAKLQDYICRYSDLRYCLSLLLADFYKDSSNLNIAGFLDTETRLFDFLVKVALYSKTNDTDFIFLIKSLCFEALSA